MLISIRLNYLHISFLLRRLLLPRLGEPDVAIIEVAQQMLHLIVEIILLREELANSGTGLDWKVHFKIVDRLTDADYHQIAYYGLPCAGILLLAMLRQQRDSDYPRVPKVKVLEDLTVLAAEVERGTVVRPEEPNYALLSNAAQAIHRFLNCIHSDEGIGVTAQEQTQFASNNDWLEQWDHDPLEFDIDFWQGLGDHSASFNIDLPIPD